MDWKCAHVLSLVLLVLIQVILADAKSTKESQDDAAQSFKEVPHQSGTKIIYLTDRNTDDNAFHNESSVAFNRDSSSEESPVFQIDTPIRVKKIRRRFKTIRNGEKSSNVRNSTSNDSNNQLRFAQASDLSSSEESLSAEETRNDPENNSDTSRESTADNHFVPSEDFPKKIVSQSRHRFSNSRASFPAENGETRHALDVQSDSSEDTSRSDISRERFGERKRKPSNFRNQQSDIIPPDARKVTIVKEKTIHSTSSEAAQERVNIEKHPHSNGVTSDVQQHQQPRTFPSPQILGNVQPQNLNRGNQKIIFIEGQHIPGRNYGPEDDTFGFYANSNAYKDKENTAPPNQQQNGRKIKVVKVIKTKPDNHISGQIQLNNHKDGQSLQYFVSEHPNAQRNKDFNEQHLKNQFSGHKQTSVSDDVPTLSQNNQNQFNTNNINAHNTQMQHIPFSQNSNHNQAIPQNHLQSNINNNNNNNKFYYMDGDQPVMLNIIPDPNEIYIDENTGQLMKFIIIEDSNQQLVPQNAGNTFSNEKQLQNNAPQHFSQPVINAGGKLHQKGTGEQQPNSFQSFGKQNFDTHVPSNINLNQQNHRKNSQNIGPQHFSQPDIINTEGFLHQKERDEQQPNLFQSLEKPNFHSHVPSSINVNQQNHQQNFHNAVPQHILQPGLNAGGSSHQNEIGKRQPDSFQSFGKENNAPLKINTNQQNAQVNIQHVPVSGGSIFHVNVPDRGNIRQKHQFSHHTPQGHNIGQENVQGLPNSNVGSEEYVLVCDQDSQDYSAEYQSQNVGPKQQGLNTRGNNRQQKSFQGPNLLQNIKHQLPVGVTHNTGQSFQYDNHNGNLGYNSNSGNHAQHLGFQQPNLNDNKDLSNTAILQVNIGGQGHHKGSEFSNTRTPNNFEGYQINTNTEAHYKGSNFNVNEGVPNVATPHNTITNQGHYKGSEFSNTKSPNNFASAQVNPNAQGHYKGSEYHSNDEVANIPPPHNSVINQEQYESSGFLNNEGVTNFATPNSDIGAQGQYKGSDLAQNKAATNFVKPQGNIGLQGHYKGSEFSNGKSNQAVPQIPKGSQGHYKGSNFGNNNGIANFSPPKIHQAAQSHYKGSEFTHINNNKGVTNYAVPQNTGGNNENYKDSQDSNYKGAINFANQQVIGGAQGNFKGTENSNNKGISNFAIRDQSSYGGQQINPGSQGHYKGSEFSNEKSNTASFEGQNINTGGAKFVDDKGVTHIVTPQVFVLDSQSLGKGSGLSQNQGDGNYAILQLNVGPQGLQKGSDFNNNKDNKNFDTRQTNIGGHGQYDGSQVLNSKGGTNFGVPQSNIAVQGHYKGSKFSTQNQNSKLPVYREVVTPPSVTKSFFTMKANSKGPSQNQGNYKGGPTNIANPDYTSNTGGFLNNQRQNVGGNVPQLSLNQHSIDSGNTYKKGNQLTFGGIRSNTLSNNPQFPAQTEYKGGNEGFSNSQAYNSGKQDTNSYSSNGGQGDLVLLIQKGYNAESGVFPPDKVRQLFSSKTPIKNSIFPNRNGYNSGRSKGLINYQDFNTGKSAESFPNAISPKNLNKGSEFFINKGPVANSDLSYKENTNSGNKAFSVNQAYNRHSNKFNNNKHAAFSNNKGNEENFGTPHINKGSAKFVDNKGVTHIVTPQVYILDSQNLGKGKELSNNKGSQRGANSYSEDTNKNLNGIPIHSSQNVGYNNQLSSVPAFQKNTGPTQYGNQRTLGYRGRSANNGLKSQQHNNGNNQYGVSYSSSEENNHQANTQPSSSEEEPIQLLLVEEDIPDHKNKNNDGVYYIQYPTTAENSQEQSYLILDDSAVQQHPNLKVMVDGGKDHTYPIRNLLKTGFHAARAVIPQIPEIKKNKKKNKSISVNFGIEFKKANDRSDSQEYIQSRIDTDDDTESEKEANKQNSEEKTEKVEAGQRIQSRIDKEIDVILETVENKENGMLKSKDFSKNEKEVLNNQNNQKDEEKSR